MRQCPNLEFSSYDGIEFRIAALEISPVKSAKTAVQAQLVSVFKKLSKTQGNQWKLCH
jgi:hypothetical protein